MTTTKAWTLIKAGRSNGATTRRGVMALMLIAGAAWANDIAVTNITWNTAGAGLSDIQFDLSWQNSWRATWTEAGVSNVSGSDLAVENWDAAWVFVKYRVENGTGWKHATLSTNSADYITPAGSVLNVGRTDDGTKGVGVLIYRSATGDGNVNYANVRLRWQHGTDGVANPNKADLAVHAIEMVYVAGGPFALGDTSLVNSRFRAGATATTPFLVNAAWDASSGSGPDARRITDQANRLWAAGNIVAGTLHDEFPTGYRAFYCMKYSITQGQYADFLNTLTLQQAGYRAYTGGANRHTISVAGGVYSATAPDRACNYLAWGDLAAYSCWAGLRPMTELEYEKACRGPMNALLNEFAWGTAPWSADSGLQGVDGSGSEYYTTGNARVDAAGPVRVGVFARPTSTRTQAGASYWGIMELSGNVSTFTATAGTVAGQAFRGLHGAGTLTASGATTISWPLGGIRGNYYNAITDVYTSTRRGAIDAAAQLNFTGGRAVRTAP